MSSKFVTMLSWGARLLYVGPSFNLKPHRSAISVFCIGLDGDLAITTNPATSGDSWMRCRSVFVPAGLYHIIDFRAAAIGCLYVDPQSDDSAKLAAGMSQTAYGVAVSHPQEEGLLSLFNQISAADLVGSTAKTAVMEIFHLSQPTVRDDRVMKAVEIIRNNPSGRHSLTSLARRIGISESRLRHSFKEATGVPLKRYRLWTRIGAAMRETRRGASLTEAAHYAGFSSSAHLSTAYRLMFGMTPSTFMEAGDLKTLPSARI